MTIWGRALAALLAVGMQWAAAGGTVEAQQIPAVHASSLSGQRVDLPEMLKGKTGVLVLGFSKSSRAQATAWGRRLAAEYGSAGDVVYYEMPMLGAVPRLLRGAVLHSIRSEVSTPAQPHFVPLTDNEEQWRSLAHYSEPDVAYVLVVDGDGRVRSVSPGDATDTAYSGVKQRVEQLRRGAAESSR